MTKLNNDDFAKICVAVDRFREHLGRDEAINTINAIIAKRWIIVPTDDTELGVFDPDHPAMADEVANMRDAATEAMWKERQGEDYGTY